MIHVSYCINKFYNYYQNNNLKIGITWKMLNLKFLFLNKILDQYS